MTFGITELMKSKTWLKTLNICQLVCKSWNDVVDSCFRQLKMPETLKRGRDLTIFEHQIYYLDGRQIQHQLFWRIKNVPKTFQFPPFLGQRSSKRICFFKDSFTLPISIHLLTMQASTMRLSIYWINWVKLFRIVHWR